MNIDSLLAGRELDALIAEKIFGFSDIREYAEGYFGKGEVFGLFAKQRIPDFSTDIAAAWLVVEKLKREMTWYKNIKPDGFRLDYDILDNVWRVALVCDEEGVTESVEADTPQLAICRAALYGCREIVGNIANVEHAINLSNAALDAAKGE